MMLKALFYITLGMFIFWIWHSPLSEPFWDNMKQSYCSDYKAPKSLIK